SPAPAGGRAAAGGLALRSRPGAGWRHGTVPLAAHVARGRTTRLSRPPRHPGAPVQRAGQPALRPAGRRGGLAAPGASADRVPPTMTTRRVGWTTRAAIVHQPG